MTAGRAVRAGLVAFGAAAAVTAAPVPPCGAAATGAPRTAEIGAGSLPDVAAPPEAPPAPPAAAFAWRSFERPDAGFSVDLPGEPTHVTEQSDSEAGPVEARAWTVETPGLALRVEHHDLPRLAVMLLTRHRLLTTSATRLVEDRRGDEVQREDWSLDGYPGLRVLYTRSDHGGAREEARLVLVERRLFIAIARVGAGSAEAAAAEAAVRRFFESWSVWPPAPS